MENFIVEYTIGLITAGGMALAWYGCGRFGRLLIEDINRHTGYDIQMIDRGEILGPMIFLAVLVINALARAEQIKSYLINVNNEKRKMEKEQKEKEWDK